MGEHHGRAMLLASSRTTTTTCRQRRGGERDGGGKENAEEERRLQPVAGGGASVTARRSGRRCQEEARARRIYAAAARSSGGGDGVDRRRLDFAPAVVTQLPSRTASTLLRFGPDAATATVAMDPVKWDEMRNKSKAELMAQLNELKAELKRPPPVAPNKQMEELRPFLVEMSKKIKAELREVYRNREPLILDLRLNSKEDPCCTAASPPGVVMLPASSEDGEAFSEDGEGNEA
ncbi:hypothetical protein QYE76_018033 [Lolium multiflorum]|uniref:Uncharacterized protein n=1 Tax=Lolium multiflorum TaxID=4521 RepID=A0AAD8QHH9_LOLMU|nr:hypothetical protein QYE76_018033 [Lolium multiflorum]